MAVNFIEHLIYLILPDEFEGIIKKQKEREAGIFPLEDLLSLPFSKNIVDTLRNLFWLLADHISIDVTLTKRNAG